MVATVMIELVTYPSPRSGPKRRIYENQMLSFSWQAAYLPESAGIHAFGVYCS